MDTRSRPASRGSMASRRTASSMPLNQTLLVEDLPAGKTRTGSAARNPPTWSRDVDVTFQREAPKQKDVANSGKDHPNKATPGSVLREKKARGGLIDVEAFTHAAIVSGLNYRPKRAEPGDEPFRKVLGGLHLLQSVQHPVRASTNKNDSHPLFSLPERVRRHIWRYIVLPPGQDRPTKPVRLQAFRPFLKDVWLPTDFQKTSELFQYAQGALSVCSNMRAEVLAYILTTHRFHFTFSPYVRKKTCPELWHWMNQYGHLMKLVTLELDLSKLDFGADPSAVGLFPGTLNMDLLVDIWADIQMKRQGSVNMSIENLVLLARRFHGLRPLSLEQIGADPQAKPLAYCSPSAEYAASRPLTKLANQVRHLRIAGFSRMTTDRLLLALFPDIRYTTDNAASLNNHCHRAGICSIWPFLPGQSSIHRDKQFGIRSGSDLFPAKRECAAEVESMTRPTSLKRQQIIDLLALLESDQVQQKQFNKQRHLRRENRDVNERNSTEVSAERAEDEDEDKHSNKRKSISGISRKSRGTSSLHGRNVSRELKRISLETSVNANSLPKLRTSLNTNRPSTPKSSGKHIRSIASEEKRRSKGDQTARGASAEAIEAWKLMSLGRCTPKSVRYEDTPPHSRKSSEVLKPVRKASKEIMATFRAELTSQTRGHEVIFAEVNNEYRPFSNGMQASKLPRPSQALSHTHSRNTSFASNVSNVSSKTYSSPATEDDGEVKRLSKDSMQSVDSHVSKTPSTDSGLGLEAVEKPASVKELKKKRSFRDFLRRSKSVRDASQKMDRELGIEKEEMPPVPMIWGRGQNISIGYLD